MERLEEERKRKALAFGDEEQMRRARVISRRQYKKKRVPQQLELFRRRVQDEADYFDDEELTQKELQRRRVEQKVLNIAEAAVENRKEERGGYYIPSAYDRTEEGLLDKAARKNVMKGRYEV